MAGEPCIGKAGGQGPRHCWDAAGWLEDSPGKCRQNGGKIIHSTANV